MLGVDWMYRQRRLWKIHSRWPSYRAHRFSFLLATGEEPEVVAHKCNNPNCVRPSHLEAGDSLTNMLDFVKRKYLDRAA